MDDEYPILEDLVIMHHTKASAILPAPVRAPHLHHLTLIDFALPIRSLLLTTAVLEAAYALGGNPMSLLKFSVA